MISECRCFFLGDSTALERFFSFQLVGYLDSGILGGNHARTFLSGKNEPPFFFSVMEFGRLEGEHNHI